MAQHGPPTKNLEISTPTPQHSSAKRGSVNAFTALQKKNRPVLGDTEEPNDWVVSDCCANGSPLGYESSAPTAMTGEPPQRKKAGRVRIESKLNKNTIETTNEHQIGLCKLSLDMFPSLLASIACS